MNRRARKAWKRYVASNTTADYCRWFHYANDTGERAGAIVYLAAHC